jgi:hypothetical protein
MILYLCQDSAELKTCDMRSVWVQGNKVSVSLVRGRGWEANLERVERNGICR